MPADRIAGVAQQEIAAQLIVVHGQHRSGFPHPGVDAKGQPIVAAPFNILHRTTRFAFEINKPAPAALAFNQCKASLHRAALQPWHREAPALRAVVITYRIHAVQPLGHNFITIVIGSVLRLVEIETGGEDPPIALLYHLAQRVLSLPGLNQNAFRQVRVINLIPADHLPVVFFEDCLQPAVEVRLQRVAIGQPLLAHKRLDSRVSFPLTVVHFIPADMQIRSGENSRSLGDHASAKA